MKNSETKFKNILFRQLILKRPTIEVYNFYNQTIKFCEERVEELDTNPNSSEAKDIERQQNLNFYKRYSWYLRQNTFLMIFSCIEELMVMSYSYLFKEEIQGKGNGIKRFVTPFKGRGIDLTKIKKWNYLTDCQKVRNVLLHANGCVSISKRKAEIEKIVGNIKYSNVFGLRSGLFRILDKDNNDKTIYLEIKEEALVLLDEAREQVEEILLG